MAEYEEAEIWSDGSLPRQQVAGEFDKSKKLFEDMVDLARKGWTLIRNRWLPHSSMARKSVTSYTMQMI